MRAERTERTGIPFGLSGKSENVRASRDSRRCGQERGKREAGGRGLWTGVPFSSSVDAPDSGRPYTAVSRELSSLQSPRSDYKTFNKNQKEGKKKEPFRKKKKKPNL